MADESGTTERPSKQDLFDDSDEDEDEAPLSTQPTTQPANVSQTQLFGDESDDTDDEPPPAAGTDNSNADADVDANDKDGADAGGESKESKSDEQVEEESDEEFKDDGITGKKAPISKQRGKSASGSASGSEQKVVQHITVPKVSFPHMLGKKATLHMAQLPKVVAIQPEAFNTNTYNSELENTEFKGRVHSMIRWRYKKDQNGDKIRGENGKLVRESNAKIIKWSDGSYGLRVGDEIFDMDENSYALTKKKQNMKGGPNAKLAAANANRTASNKPNSKDYLYLTQKVQTEEDGETKNIGTILECVASLQSKFKPRPASLKSASHRNFVMTERSRVMKRSQIQEFNTFVDPEKEKAERIRNKEDLAKNERRSGKRSGGGGGGRKRYGMQRAYMQADEDDYHYDTVNIRTLKRKNEDDDMGYGEGDMMSDEEDEWSKRKKRGFESGRKQKSSSYLSDDDEEEEMVLDDDEEEEMVNRKNTNRGAGQKRKATLFDDDDDSDE